MPTDYHPNGKHTAGEETHRRLQRVFELRRENVSFPQIAIRIAQEEGREQSYTQGYIYKLYKKGLKQIIVEDVEAVRKIELARLDKLQEYANNLLEGFQPLVNRGAIVTDFLEGENGKLVLDKDGNPIPIKLQDFNFKLHVLRTTLAIMERRAKVLGIDAPTKVAATNPDGTREAIPASIRQLTPEQLAEEAARRGLPATIFQTE